MTESKISNDLVNQEARKTTGVNVESIIKRERRRVRFWAIATAVLWVFAALYLFCLLWIYAIWLHPLIHEFVVSENPVSDDVMQKGMAVMAKLLMALLYWPGLLCLAAACTLFFTLTSRSATLRQIQTSLTEIGSQLRELSEKTSSTNSQ